MRTFVARQQSYPVPIDRMPIRGMHQFFAGIQVYENYEAAGSVSYSFLGYEGYFVYAAKFHPSERESSRKTLLYSII